MGTRSLLIAFAVILLSSNAYGADGTGHTYAFGCRLLASETRLPSDKIEAVKWANAPVPLMPSSC
jgi:hypothetical protein